MLTKAEGFPMVHRTTSPANRSKSSTQRYHSGCHLSKMWRSRINNTYLLLMYLRKKSLKYTTCCKCSSPSYSPKLRIGYPRVSTETLPSTLRYHYKHPPLGMLADMVIAKSSHLRRKDPYNR